MKPWSSRWVGGWKHALRLLVEEQGANKGGGVSRHQLDISLSLKSEKDGWRCGGGRRNDGMVVQVKPRESQGTHQDGDEETGDPIKIAEQVCVKRGVIRRRCGGGDGADEDEDEDEDEDDVGDDDDGDDDGLNEEEEGAKREEGKFQEVENQTVRGYNLPEDFSTDEKKGDLTGGEEGGGWEWEREARRSEITDF
eukprot:746545-Hanusia_phi.AAC.1